jgi:hypothetical protein
MEFVGGDRSVMNIVPDRPAAQPAPAAPAAPAGRTTP